jgi:hypothetical protein
VRRALAVLGAVAMVALAVVVRQQIEDDDEGASPGDSGGLVICATDLAEVCDALSGVEVRTEDAAVTAAALADGALDDDAAAWVTTSAWVDVVHARAEGAIGEPERLARSRVVAAVDGARVEAVRALCGDAVWRCLGERAGQQWSDLGGAPPWGAVKTGMPDGNSAVGLAVIAAVVSGYFGSTDFARNDFESGAMIPWLEGLTNASEEGDPDPVGTLVTRRGTYTAAAGPAAQAARVGGRVAVLESLPDVPVEVVLAPFGDTAPDGAGALRDALVRAGWDRAEGEVPPRYKPGVLAALHKVWTEVTR